MMVCGNPTITLNYVFGLGDIFIKKIYRHGDYDGNMCILNKFKA